MSDFTKKTVMAREDGAKVVAENALDYHNYVARGFRATDEELPAAYQDDEPEAEQKDEEKPAGTSSVPAVSTGAVVSKPDAKAADSKK
ncbi:hypothetical protein BJD55_gp182 [Gordonia phage Yvonnetastic]|uniref:Uncharacterized protein n=1 Tax=Gordonia phage Yvonnetastic TaxID=1821566 RepID=A0A142K901_9CAUD|nr:hypothetical protein BJD55_gp182 [Gordonia phage Yvonnetastic]AMS02584.1 hypothetical protein SEA_YVONNETASTIC_40 [Gordonia phage Yvonnetastic]